MNNMPLIFQNAILNRYSSIIKSYIDGHQDDFGELDGSYWGGRTIHIPKIKNINVVNILKEYKYELINNYYSLSEDSKPIYIDSLHLVRWPIGYELKPHADAENPDGAPHPFPWRNFGTVGFLNDDFEGGELYLPNKNIVIKSKIGHSVIFPGTLEYLHGVKPIISGTRYTIASFLTYDQSHEYKF